MRRRGFLKSCMLAVMLPVARLTVTPERLLEVVTNERVHSLITAVLQHGMPGTLLYRSVIMARDLEVPPERWPLSIDGTLDLYAGLLLEVKAATEDGRLTTILDGDGNRYPVPNAMQFLLASRMLDQLVKIAQVGRALSEAYRGRSAADGNGKAGGGSGDDPSDWPAQRFIDVLRAGEMRVPKALEAKVASLLAD